MKAASIASPPTAPPRWRSTCRSGRRWRCCAPATDSWSAPATWAASTAPCPWRRARRPTCRACSTASTGRAGACSAGMARTTSPSRAVRATPPSPTPPGPASRPSSGRARPPRAASARSPARPPATSSTARRFGAPDGRLAAVTLAYLPQNQRARITELGPADSGAPAPAIGALGALAATATTPAAARAHQTVHQAALEGGEPRRRRAELPARLPPGERRRLAPAGRSRPADQDRIRLEHRGAARRDLRRQGHRQRRALRTARARAGHDVHVVADPGRQPQARGASVSR